MLGRKPRRKKKAPEVSDELKPQKLDHNIKMFQRLILSWMKKMGIE